MPNSIDTGPKVDDEEQKKFIVETLKKHGEPMPAKDLNKAYVKKFGSRDVKKLVIKPNKYEFFGIEKSEDRKYSLT